LVGEFERTKSRQKKLFFFKESGRVGQTEL